MAKTIKPNFVGLLLLLVAACGSSDPNRVGLEITPNDEGEQDGGEDQQGEGALRGRNSSPFAGPDDKENAADAGVGLDAPKVPIVQMAIDAKSTADAKPNADAKHITTPTTAPVSLGTANAYAILTKTGVTTVPPSSIDGDVGVSPAAATSMTGFALKADASNVFSTSTQVTGRIYAADYRAPTPPHMTKAIGDMEGAFTEAGSRTPNAIELDGGDIDGKTLAPGIYKWSTALLISNGVTLQGSADGAETDVWILQITQGLTLGSDANVVLAGGALPKNVFWQVSGAVVLGTNSHLEGTVLGKTSIALATGASVNGRLLAQTAVTLDANKIVAPAP